MAEPKDVVLSVDDLPISFQVKYLGSLPAKGLWGIKHTRKPVDALVEAAKKLPSDTILPLVKIRVTRDGLSFKTIVSKGTEQEQEFKVDAISYGVQDLIYTRVFSMIVVTDHDLKQGMPFDCHAFVCESRNQARQLTYALAAAFQEYGKKIKEDGKNNPAILKKKFAIDLRTPEELQQAAEDETEA